MVTLIGRRRGLSRGTAKPMNPRVKGCGTTARRPGNRCAASQLRIGHSSTTASISPASRASRHPTTLLHTVAAIPTPRRYSADTDDETAPTRTTLGSGIDWIWDCSWVTVNAELTSAMNPATRTIDTNIHTIPVVRPQNVTGVRSPYPTVLMVLADHQMASPRPRIPGPPKC